MFPILLRIRHDIFGDEEETNKNDVFCLHTRVDNIYVEDIIVITYWAEIKKNTSPLIGNPRSTPIGKDALFMFITSILGRTRPDPLTSKQLPVWQLVLVIVMVIPVLVTIIDIKDEGRLGRYSTDLSIR